MEKDSSFARGDIYTRVTNEIIQAIEAGVDEYRMPWHQRSGAGLPRNAATGNLYRGINNVALWATSHLRGYALPYWATYRQWGKLGAQVRRGEKASIIVFYKQETPSATEEENGDTKNSRRIVRASFVFNAQQVDGWPYPEPQGEDRTERLEKVDAFISSLGAEIRYGSDMAYYSKKFDRIHMPDRHDFMDRATGTATEGFYSVLLHEHLHWSGHPKRLSRDLSDRFGSDAYAMEELVAELGAAFLCADLGISVYPRRDHAAYVHSWLSVLRQQKTAIVGAAGAAMTACRYLGELVSKKERAA